MSVNGYVSGYYATVKLTSLLSGGDDTELISEIIKTFRRIKDVPENLIIAILVNLDIFTLPDHGL